MHNLFFSLTHMHYDLVTIMVFIGIGLLLTLLLPRILRHYYNMQPGKVLWHHAVLGSLAAPVITFYWAWLITFLIPHTVTILQHPLSVKTLDQLLLLGAIFWLTMRIFSRYERLVKLAIMNEVVEYNLTTVRAFIQFGRMLLIIGTILSVMQIFNTNISALLAVGGIGSLAVSFAAKDNLANFLSGMMLFIDRPFSVGDWIRSPDRNIEGTVENIGWRLTMIRTFDKRPLYVPNAVFSTISVENPSRMTNRRIKTNIGLRYDDAQKVAPVLAAIEKMLHEHKDIDQKQMIMVNLSEFGASSLVFFVYCFTKTTKWHEFQIVQQDVFLKILNIIAEHGAECAFPTTTVHVPDEINLLTKQVD